MTHRLPIELVAFFMMAALSFVSCKKEAPYMDDAEISADTRQSPCLANDLCKCPGGFFVVMALPNRVRGTITFKAPNLPQSFLTAVNFNRNGSPLAVKINWTYDTTVCKNFIVITKITLR